MVAKQAKKHGVRVLTVGRAARRQDGMALLLLVIALAVATVLSTAFLTAQSTSTAVAQNVEHHPRARFVAESGLVTAIEYVRSDPNWRGDRNEGQWVVDHPFEGGAFSIVAYDGEDTNGDGQYSGNGDFGSDPTEPVTLIATGTFNGTTSRATAILRPTDGDGDDGGASDFGVLTLGDIRLTGNAHIDSYDSSEGSYGWGNSTNKAVVGTNANDNNVVQITGSSSIGGDVWVGPDADADQAVNSPPWADPITGTVDNLPEALPLGVPEHGIDEPMTSPGIPNWGSVSFGSPGTTEEYHWDELITGGSVIVNIDGPVRALVEGDVHFGGGSQVRINDGGSLELFVKGSFTTNGSVPVNEHTGDPANFSVYMIEGGDVSIGGSARVHGTILGPGSDATIHGSGRLFGGFHGQSLHLQGSGMLHQDLNTPMPYAGGGGGGSGGGYTVIWR